MPADKPATMKCTRCDREVDRVVALSSGHTMVRMKVHRNRMNDIKVVDKQQVCLRCLRQMMDDDAAEEANGK